MEELRQPIILMDHQIQNAAQTSEILSRNYFALNGSQMGTGKSWVAMDAAINYKHCLVISSASIINTSWIGYIKREFIVPEHVQFISFEKLRGKTDKPLSHGFLSRLDFRKEVGKRRVAKTKYFITNLWEQMCKDGCLLIVDEMQFVKNINLTSKAISALISEISETFKSGGKSRTLLMSGSIIDNPKQAQNYFKMLGVMQSKASIANPKTKKKIFPGIEEVERFCGLSTASEEKKRKTVDYLGFIFESTFREKFCCFMEPPKLRHMLKYNWFCSIDSKEKASIITEAVQNLEKITLADKREKGDQSIIFTLMQKIESAKVETFAKCARKLLLENPNRKIVIGLSYLAPIEQISNLLSDFKPNVITGSVPTKRRLEAIEEFQKPNLDCRLIIAQIKTISTGISLHDLDGRFPRMCLISPTYNVMEIFQVGHRFSRIGTKSTPELRVLYALDNKHEMTVIDLLCQKSTVMASFHEKYTNGVVFPKDFADMF